MKLTPEIEATICHALRTHESTYPDTDQQKLDNARLWLESVKSSIEDLKRGISHNNTTQSSKAGEHDKARSILDNM